jgi:fatty acid desaturase
MQVQTYEPYRTNLLSKSDLIELYLLNSRVVMIDTISAWIVIVLSWSVVAYYPYWWVALVAIPVIGTRLYSLFIIAHDGLHRRLFKSINDSDLWNDLFILGAIGTITRLNRINHMRHHRELALPTDPDRFKYTQTGRSTRLEFIISLTCVPLLIKAIRNVMLPPDTPNLQGDEGNGKNNNINQIGRYKKRDIVIIVLWQIALIGGLTSLIGWWAYPVLWVSPVFFALCCDILRVFCEHSQLTNDLDADSSMRLVSYDAGFFERVLFAPNNMNHHIAHHLWPAIPYYNLPKAEKLIRSKLDNDLQLVWRPSYFGHICSYWHWLGQENAK